MLASRMVRIAEDILREYRELGIEEIIGSANSLATQRTTMNQTQYVAQARDLRAKAGRMAKASVVRLYPENIRAAFLSSTLAPTSPERIASIIDSGFPDDAANGLSSNEFRIYSDSIIRLVALLTSLVSGANAIGFEPIHIPPDMISIDITIPREFVSNKVGNLLLSIGRFNSVIVDITELASGSREQPSLVFTSTTDPVFALATYGAAAWGFLQFYKLALEVAEKQLNLIKTISNFLKTGLKPDAEETVKNSLAESLEKQMDLMVEECVKRIIKKLDGEQVQPTKASLEIGRVHELIISIRKQTKPIVDAISEGARINVTIESLDRLPLIASAVPGLTLEMVKQELNEQKRAELTVQNARALLENHSAALLTNSSSHHDLDSQ